MADNEELGLATDDAMDSMANGQDAELIDDTDAGDGDLSAADSANVDDPELEAIKARVREMKEEAEKLKQLQSEVDKQMNLGSPPSISENRTTE